MSYTYLILSVPYLTTKVLTTSASKYYCTPRIFYGVYIMRQLVLLYVRERRKTYNFTTKRGTSQTTDARTCAGTVEFTPHLRANHAQYLPM